MMFSLDKMMYNVLGGYTHENESVDRNNENIVYELKSIFPTEEVLGEILEVAATIQSEKRY